MSKKILITGANGLVGQKIIQVLNEENKAFFHERKAPPYEILAISKGDSKLPKRWLTALHYQSLDLTNASLVKDCVLSFKPHFIIHSAAMTKVDDCEQHPELATLTNIEATRFLIEAAEKINAFFLYISTDFVFAGNQNGLHSETDAPNPINFYGKTKLEAEKIVQKSQLEWSIVRTCLVYGVTPEMSRSNIILWVKNSLEQEKHIKVVADQWRTPTLAEDLANACVSILKQKARGIYHISGDEFITPYHLALMTAKLYGLNDQLISPTDASQFKEVGTRPLKTGFDISKAKQILSYQPHSLHDGLLLVLSQIKDYEKRNLTKENN
ncbi:MAG: dTDP-4-dehydrorhamnose reductase [Flammeovirgaceae bacterium]